MKLHTVFPDLETIRELSAGGLYRTAPVSTEILSDVKTPIEVLKILKNISGHCYLLESVSESGGWGRYTFLGYDPSMEITCLDGKMKAGSLSFETRDPGSHIRQIIEENKSPRFLNLPPFTGGLVGYFSYDYLKYSEPSLHLDASDTEGFQDVDLMLFDKVIAFDHFRQKIILIVNIKLDSWKTEYNRALLELQHMADLIQYGSPCAEPSGRCTTKFTPLFQQEEYCAMVEKAKYHIREGDIFQIVLSNRWKPGLREACLAPTVFCEP